MTTAMSAQRPARLYSESSASARSSEWSKPLIETRFEPATATVWSTLAPYAPTHVSSELLRELSALSNRIREGRYGQLRYKVISSELPGIFSLGGDLELFLAAIERRDRNTLFEYGKAAIDEVWANVTGCGRREVTTIAVVEGEAQGGGFEAVLSCHVIVAEAGTSFGFPESLFGLFPGMGALPLLTERTDSAVASRIVSRADRYSAEFLHDIGVVDHVVPRGTARQFVRDLLNTADSRSNIGRKDALARVNYSALLRSVEQWVETALNLNDKHKRSMSYLLRAQRRLH